MKKLLLVVIAILIASTIGYAQLSGTKYIPGDYSTIAAAIADLNTQGVGSGGVTFNVAAGHTEVLTGRIDLTATGTASDPIIFQKFGTGTNPLLTAYTGTSTPGSATPDGMWALVGADYVTIDGIDLYDPNTSNPQTMEYGYGLFKSSATNGCQYVTIKNCIITLNRVNNATGSGPMPDGSTGILVVNSIPTAATTALTITAASGSNSFNAFYSNTIQNSNNGIVLMGFAATVGVGPNPDPGTFFGDLGNDIGGNSVSTGNVIKNFGGGGSSNPSAGIRANNQWSINISYNTINNNDGAGVNHATTLRGIFAQAGTSANANINYNNISIQSGATTSSCWAIDNGIGSTAAGNTININNNIIRVGYPTATTGVYTAINNSATAATVNINYNDISQITGVAFGGTGTHVMIETGSPTTVYTNNNNIHDISRNGTSGSWRGIKTTSPTNWICNNNLIENLSWTATTSTGGFDGIYSFSSAVNVTANGNIIRNISTPTTGTLTGIREYGNAGNKIFQNNQIYNFFTTSGGAGGATLNGIWTTTGNIEISNNKIYSLNSTGTTGGTAGTIYGIQVTGGTLISIFKNNIYDLSTMRTGSPTAPVLAGIHTTSGTTTYIYNNFISDLRTPALSYTEALRGISIANTTSGNTYGVYFNTIFLNATSTGTTFGTSAIFANTSPTVDMRNNIIINTSSPAGTGLTVAYRRSSTTLTTYASTSNNNAFYAGTPAANRLIFYDGTNSDQTITAYKTRVAPRDGSSFSENVPFVNSTTPPYDLHISTTTPTQTESGGSAITSPITINDDYDGDTRASIPDVGADEFNGVGLDLSPPVIAYTPLGNSSNTISRTFSGVVITDASGVETTPGLRPRVYFKRSTDANTFNDNTNATDGWKYAEAQGTGGSPFSFVMDYSLLYTGGVPLGPGSVIQYFVVAQDITPTPNVGINSGIFAAQPSSVDLTSAAFPITGTINSFNIVQAFSGTYSVGTTGTYPNLTGAGGFFAAVNGGVVSDNIIVQIVSDLTEDGTNALNQWAEEGAGNYTMTIVSVDAVEKLISGNVANGMIRLNGADRVTIDGRVLGSGKYLRFRNTNTSNPTFTFINGAVDNVIRDCYIEGASTSSLNGVVFFSTGDNINNTLLNCDIRDRSDAAGRPYNSVYFGALTNLNNKIKNCRLYDFTNNAVYISSATGTLIESCDIYTTTASTASSVYGFYVANTGASVKTTITKSKIHDLNGSSTATIKGVYIAGASGVNTLLSIENNFIYLSPTTTGVIDGIDYYGYTANSLDIYFNSIYIGGSLTSGSNSSTAIRKRDAATNFNIKNNILFNARTNAGGTANHYAIYVSNTTGTLAFNYNDYFVNGTGGVLGYWSTANQNTLADWQTASGQDANSISGDPKFVSANDLHIDVYQASPVSNAGISIAGINEDIDGDLRQSPPDIGADEFTGVPPNAFSLLTPTNGATNVPLNGDLTWEVSQYAQTYDVYLDKVDATTLVSADQTATIYSYSNLDPNSVYYWKVVAKNGNGTTQATGSPWSFTTVALLPPNSPSDLTISNITTDAMDLSWTDNSNDELGFYIYKSTDGSTFTLVDSVNADVISYTGPASRSLSPNTRYWWRVTAYNANGESAPTGANAFTLALTPGAPTLSNATMTTMLVILNPAGNPAATQFAVRVVFGATTKYMNTAGALVDNPVWGTYSNFGGAAGKTLTGLSPITAYTIDVKARNGANIETDFGPSSTLATTGTPYPVVEGFELTTFPPTAWLVENTNGDAKTWVRTTSNVRSGVGAAMYPYSLTLPADDWLFTLPLTMEAGNKYRLTYYYRAYSASYPEKMKVMFGTAQNSASMTDLLADHTSITNTTYLGNSVVITPPATGIYYVGFYAYSAANMWNLYIDDIMIEVMPQKDIEVVAVNLSAPPYYVGQPITVSAQIRNNGTEADPTTVPLTYKIGSAPDYQGDGVGELFTPSWASNMATVTFTVPYTPGSTGNVTIFVKSFYTGDQVPANDAKSKSVKVLPAGALFEDWTDVNALARWKVVNNDGGAQIWRRATEKFLSSPASAGSDYESSTLKNDDWLITPKLSVIAGDSLTFWHSARSTSFPESLYVRLSTVGNNPSDPWIDLLAIKDATTDWKYKSVDLTPWAGQNVWIAFVNRGLDQYTIYIDDITGPALYIPEYDLAFTDFYQSSGLPTPKVDKISDREVWMMNETIDEKPIATLADKGIVELRESEISKTIVYPSNSLPSLDKKLNPIDVKAEITNVGKNPVAYTLDWNVSGAAQPTYIGPSVDSAATHIANLTFNPTTRGTFLTSGAITVTGDENPDNNTNYFRMRVYPDDFARTIYDRGDNVVDTWVGWGSATLPMKAGVRFTAPNTMRLAGVDFIYRTESVVSGDIIVTVRGAGDSLTGPGPVLYSKIFNAADYFTGAGDYVTFPFDDNAPVIAGGSDYWITIKMPAGILYPGAVHNNGFTSGRSFYEGAIDQDTTKWYPLVITTERAWVMRSYFVAPPNSIAGVKFNDLNGNGQKDEGEPGLEGWYISLNGPVNDVKVTGPDGSYYFGDLPDGEYLITEDNQAGWIQTMPAAPGSYTVAVSGGMNVTGKDFGNFKLGKISGYKWEDLDGDGVWDAGEPTVPNWQITLSGPVSGSTYTDENGWYVFENLTVGEYTVSEIIPSGWFFTYPTPNQHVVNISSGTEINGGGGIAEVPNFGNARYGTVSGAKFWDRNNNGIRDVGEAGLANWTILLTGDHTIQRSTETDSLGNFLFENVVPDNYVLSEVLKPGWTMTTSPAPFMVSSGSVVTDKLFGNFLNVDITKYRSFVPEDLVALDSKGKVPKAVKRKPVGAYWEFMIINPKEYPLTLLNIQFKNDVREIVEAGSFNVSGAKKDFMLSDAELAPGDTLVVKGYSLKGKPQEIKKLWYGPKTSIPATSILPVYQYLELPQPTWRNMIDEIFTEGGFTDDGGLLVGQKGDPKKIGWVLITKSGDVVKSLYNKGIHNAGPKFFRTFDNNKPFLKEQKSLPPTKQNNMLFAEIVAAKLAIAASKLGKIPAGYGDLIFIDDEPTWHPFNNMTVEEIVDSISNAMNTFEGDSADYYRILRKLNTAFAGPIDTAEFATRTVLKGVKPLAEVPYLFANPDGKVSKIEPKPIVYSEIPSSFELSQNYPNPFNPSTTIEFTLPEDAIVTLKVYNVLGQEVATLIDNELYTEGLNEVEFDAGKLSSGVYFYRLVAETLGDSPMKYSQVKKMVLMK